MSRQSEEFNLSEKINQRIKDNEWAICYDRKIRSSEFCRGEINGLRVLQEDVKEFIRLLKEEIRWTFNKWEIDEFVQDAEIDKIDKLAGEKLK